MWAYITTIAFAALWTSAQGCSHGRADLTVTLASMSEAQHDDGYGICGDNEWYVRFRWGGTSSWTTTSIQQGNRVTFNQHTTYDCIPYTHTTINIVVMEDDNNQEQALCIPSVDDQVASGTIDIAAGRNGSGCHTIMSARVCVSYSWQDVGTRRPTQAPTRSPVTISPSTAPTKVPTQQPTFQPTTLTPTRLPSTSPSQSPTRSHPTQSPTVSPTISPTISPTLLPTSSPSASPSTFAAFLASATEDESSSSSTVAAMVILLILLAVGIAVFLVIRYRQGGSPKAAPRPSYHLPMHDNIMYGGFSLEGKKKHMGEGNVYSIPMDVSGNNTAMEGTYYVGLEQVDNNPMYAVSSDSNSVAPTTVGGSSISSIAPSTSGQVVSGNFTEKVYSATDSEYGFEQSGATYAVPASDSDSTTDFILQGGQAGQIISNSAYESEYDQTNPRVYDIGQSGNVYEIPASQSRDRQSSAINNELQANNSNNAMYELDNKRQIGVAQSGQLYSVPQSQSDVANDDNQYVVAGLQSVAAAPIHTISEPIDNTGLTTLGKAHEEATA